MTQSASIIADRLHRDHDTSSYPPHIARSWQRCRAIGLQPDIWLGGAHQHYISPKARVLSSFRPILEDIYEFLENSWAALVLSDEDGCIVDMIGDADVLDSLHRIGLGYASVWQEATIGTNALALALRDGHPVATVGQAHFFTRLHELSIVAAPLFGAEGQPIGAIAQVTHAGIEEAHALSMVAAAAQLIHTRLQMERLMTDTNAHLTELNAALDAIGEGVLLINADGRIARLNRRVEQFFGLATRAAAGRRLADVVKLPLVLARAIEQQTAMVEQELLFSSPLGTVAAMCSLKPIYHNDGTYYGALLALHPPEHVRQLVHQVVGAQAEISFRDIMGESPAIQLALRQARIASNGNANVLIVGEHGTGKEFFARAIHQSSSRASGPFVTLNCATIPRTLIGTELFGFEGNSDGLARARPGKLELAQGGTLLLKGIEALPMEHQSALLRAIDSRALIRSGGRRVVPLDVRVIATTSSGLVIEDGRFRPDLAACLSGYTIELPPLRQRGHDVLLLADHSLALLNRRLGKQLVPSPDALQALQRYAWPGNIRELEATLEQVAHTIEHSVVQIDDLPPTLRLAGDQREQISSQLARHYDHLEREAILRAGRAVGGHLGRTAQQLGVSRSTLWRKMRDHGLSRLDLIEL